MFNSNNKNKNKVKTKGKDVLSKNKAEELYKSGNINTVLGKEKASKAILIITSITLVFNLVCFISTFISVSKGKASSYAFNTHKYMVVKSLTKSSTLLAEVENGKSTFNSKLFIFCKGRYWSFVDEQNKPVSLGKYKQELGKYKDKLEEVKEKESFNDSNK